ncbi:hypothetical protein FVB9288_01274 [Flavobacterium sp. CECT 9288]|nr:hypothetical protein FVB9288_01274 [Flavobacterium sp. CECT 9288]
MIFFVLEQSYFDEKLRYLSRVKYLIFIPNNLRKIHFWAKPKKIIYNSFFIKC